MAPRIVAARAPCNARAGSRRASGYAAPVSASSRFELLAVRGSAAESRADLLATEEPLEVRVAGPDGAESRVAVTMRTPGHDEELAVGFLYTEGLLEGRADLGAEPITTTSGNRGNVLTVHLRRAFDASRLTRSFYVTSSCGICGKAALEAIEQEAPPSPEIPPIPRSILTSLPAALRRGQVVFEQTGGLHAAGLFDRDGQLLALREDVGRHNAVDKVLGRLVLGGLPRPPAIVMVSGRASFELVQKVAMAAIPVLAAVSAPSSLAVDAARKLGLTLVGFLRGEAFNVYAGQRRIDLSL